MLLLRGIFGLTCSCLIYKLKKGKNIDIQQTYRDFENLVIKGIKEM